MKAQAQQVSQVTEASDSDSDDNDEEESLPESRRFASDRREPRSKRAKNGDEPPRQDGGHRGWRSASKKIFARNAEDRLETRRDRAKRRPKASKKTKIPLTTCWVRDSLSASPSRGEKAPTPALREASPSLSVAASRIDAGLTLLDPDPATVRNVRNVLKRLQNITEYLGLWTYQCEILAEQAEEEREQAESLYLLMVQARKNWHAVSSERMEKLELMLYLSPEEVMLCKDWRELLAPVLLFQEIDVDGQEQEAEELDD
ncbi:hypothetical protein B0A48_09325 [Cryoendolithus antarcticus]|uniref:Uncharacterized protein n=1 Tax=Cryoendolithus antarcticus TaxID=1507870 RepID=A0A1V8T2A0_9PEZI|nr:hypothetical protein B0A48_09325 [Cryoendolithus antarcticus]